MKSANVKVIYGLMCLITLFSGLFSYSIVNPYSSINGDGEQNENNNQILQPIINRTFSFKAAIIDHLSVSDPSPFFIKAAITMLKEANFTVDYYENDDVWVDLYRNLGTYDYGMIIFRVHSGRTPVTFFFSSEPYSPAEYWWEQLNDQIRQGQLPGENITHFTITPSFIKKAMRGSFYKTVIIVMGCGSLHTTDMAEAFISKGAAAYIGWNASLYAFHGDLATISVIKHLLLERSMVKEAVDAAMREVGPCLTSTGTSILSFYPLTSEDFTIPFVTDSSQEPQG